MALFRPSVTFAEIINQWWLEHKVQVLDTTARKKEEEMRVHILPALGSLKLSAITPQVLQGYISDKLAHGSPKRHPGGLAHSTVRDHFKIIKPAIDWAISKGYITDNPAAKVKLPRRVRHEVQTFTPLEVASLIMAARPRWMGDLITLAYRTGMRRGELFGLKWEDVDFDGEYLLVRRTISAKAPKERLIHLPKTERSRRRIDLDRLSLEMLNRRRNVATTEWVFEGRGGHLLSPWIVTKYMAMACKKTGIPHRCFHTLRHTHATLLLSKGVNPKVVQERLGHSTLEMTLGTYGHVLPTMQQAAIQVLNEM